MEEKEGLYLSVNSNDMVAHIEEEEMMSIKAFAHLCGCKEHTLRHYDHIDLLKPVMVSRSNYRYYDPEQESVYRRIRQLQGVGFTLEQIKELIVLDNDELIGRLNMKADELSATIDDIHQLIKAYERQ